MGEHVLQDSDSDLYSTKQDNIIDSGKGKEIFDFHCSALEAVFTHHRQHAANIRLSQPLLSYRNIPEDRHWYGTLAGKGKLCGLYATALIGQ
jgi:hypothetical protein